MPLASFYVIISRVTADSYNFKLTQGETFRRTITWREPSEVPGNPVAGDPYNITGATVKLPIRSMNDEEVLELTNGSGLTVNGPEGEIEILISSIESDDLSGKYKYDLSITLSGDTTYLLQGYLIVKPKVDLP